MEIVKQMHRFRNLCIHLCAFCQRISVTGHPSVKSSSQLGAQVTWVYVVFHRQDNCLYVGRHKALVRAGLSQKLVRGVDGAWPNMCVINKKEQARQARATAAADVHAHAPILPDPGAPARKAAQDQAQAARRQRTLDVLRAEWAAHSTTEQRMVTLMRELKRLDRALSSAMEVDNHTWLRARLQALDKIKAALLAALRARQDVLRFQKQRRVAVIAVPTNITHAIHECERLLRAHA